MKQITDFIIIVFACSLFPSCGKIISGGTSDGSSLEDAAQSTDSTSSGACSNGRKRIFVTAGSYSGNLGGVAGADAYCMSASNKPAGTSTYKALIVDGSSRVACTTASCSGGTAEHVGWVLAASTPYYRTDCATWINTTNSNGLLSFGLTNPISTSNVGAWTGMNNTWRTTANTCGSWTSSSSGSNGDLGFANYSNSGAINIGGASSPDSCDTSYRLYCVEQ